MAKMSTYKLNYQSDIEIGGNNSTGLYQNLPFKMRAGYEDCFATGNAYTANTASCFCPPSGLFKPRALVAKFATTGTGTALSRNCATIKFPVARPDADLIKEMIDKLKACGAVCIDLDGEEWSNIPPTLLGYNPTELVFVIPVGVVTPKVTGAMPNYISDGLGGSHAVAVRYEVLPTELTGAVVADPPIPGGTFLECHGKLADNSVCASGTGIKSRRAIIKGRAKGDGIDDLLEKPTALVRQMPIALKSDIVTCLRKIGNTQGVDCLGYKGESIRRIDLLVA